MRLLVGKTAVITGSSRGLGFAIAQAFAREGANVVLAARTESTLRHAVEMLKEQGVQAESFVCDISNAVEVEALANAALAAFGKLDIWVNNAGIGAPYGHTFSSSSKNFVNVVNTNIIGVYNGSSAAMNYFIGQGSGKLINLLGRGADGPVPFQNAYASSKAWIKAFTRTLAKEYASRGIEVMAYNPGLVLTEMLTQVDVVPGFEKKVQPLNTIIRLWANPPEIPAKKVVWLASSATDGKTGLIVNFMTPWFMIRGLVKELWRKITRKPNTLPTINVHTVEK